MKKVFVQLLLSILCSAVYASQLEWVDEQIEAIKPSRNGIEILKIEDPFLFLQKNRPETETGEVPIQSAVEQKTSTPNLQDKNETKERVFILNAIMNTSALIDGIWYQKDDTIEDYMLIDITKTTVTLKKNDKIVVLSTDSKTSTIKFKNK